MKTLQIAVQVMVVAAILVYNIGGCGTARTLRLDQFSEPIVFVTPHE